MSNWENILNPNKIGSQKFGDFLRETTKNKGREYLEKQAEKLFEENKNDMIAQAKKGENRYIIKEISKELGPVLVKKLKEEKLNAEFIPFSNYVLVMW